MPTTDKRLFLTLKIFSSTGGIERVCKIVGKALCELSIQPANNIHIYSMYDQQKDIDDKYFPVSVFVGFGIQKIHFVYKSIQQGIKSKVVILSHVNLLLVGFLIKLFSPKTKLVLIAHGIEAWKPFSPGKRFFLQKCDKILPVSHFTMDTMISHNKLPVSKFKILNNCLDPFLEESSNKEKDAILLSKYGIDKGSIVLMTLSRLSSKERYKGYDKVLMAVPQLIKEYPHLKYLLVGKCDTIEKERLTEMISEYGIQDSVIFSGFVPDSELADHYNLADIYIMPSEKEGFGIVFIEAMFYGKPVIAGNKDGSVDALCNGKLGLLVNPDQQTEIVDAIRKIINNKAGYLPDHKILMQNFSYPVYKNNLSVILDEL